MQTKIATVIKANNQLTRTGVLLEDPPEGQTDKLTSVPAGDTTPLYKSLKKKKSILLHEDGL